MTKPNRFSERSFQATVVELLQLYGCVVDHSYPLMTKHGWRTGSTLVGKPDLLALHPKRWMLAVEVKADRGALTEEQSCVLSLFAAIPCARAWVVRPDDPPWRDLQSWIKDPKAAPAMHGFETHPDPRRGLVEASRRRSQRNAEARLRRQSPRGSRGRRLDTLPGVLPLND